VLLGRGGGVFRTSTPTHIRARSFHGSPILSSIMLDAETGLTWGGST
jgi:hypothetical protein